MNAELPESTSTEEDTNTLFSNLAALQKAAGDTLRLQILRLLKTESLGVLELTRIFETKQSGMSHHLKILANAHLVTTRREGNAIFYRRALPPTSGPHSPIICALFDTLDKFPVNQGVQQKLAEIQDQRAEQSQTFFTRNIEAFRQHQELIADHELYARSVEDLLECSTLPAHETVIELGPGEGSFLPALAKRFKNVIALDNSEEMLELAREKARKAGLNNVAFKLGEIRSLVKNVQADCLIANMVLHHVPTPSNIFTAAYSVLKPGGSLFISELSEHNQSWVHELCGDLWQGFSVDELTVWAENAGLQTGESQFLGLRNGFQIQVRRFIRPIH